MYIYKIMGSLNTDTKKVVWGNTLRARYEENVHEINEYPPKKIAHVLDYDHGIVTWVVTEDDCLSSKTEVNFSK